MHSIIYVTSVISVNDVCMQEDSLDPDDTTHSGFSSADTIMQDLLISGKVDKPLTENKIRYFSTFWRKSTTFKQAVDRIFFMQTKKDKSPID